MPCSSPASPQFRRSSLLSIATNPGEPLGAVALSVLSVILAEPGLSANGARLLAAQVKRSDERVWLTTRLSRDTTSALVVAHQLLRRFGRTALPAIDAGFASRVSPAARVEMLLALLEHTHAVPDDRAWGAAEIARRLRGAIAEGPSEGLMNAIETCARYDLPGWREAVLTSFAAELAGEAPARLDDPLGLVRVLVEDGSDPAMRLLAVALRHPRRARRGRVAQAVLRDCLSTGRCRLPLDLVRGVVDGLAESVSQPESVFEFDDYVAQPLAEMGVAELPHALPRTERVRRILAAFAQIRRRKGLPRLRVPMPAVPPPLRGPERVRGVQRLSDGRRNDPAANAWLAARIGARFAMGRMLAAFSEFVVSRPDDGWTLAITRHPGRGVTLRLANTHTGLDGIAFDYRDGIRKQQGLISTRRALATEVIDALDIDWRAAPGTVTELVISVSPED